MINMSPCRAQAPALSGHIIAISKARLMCDFIGLQMLFFIRKQTVSLPILIIYFHFKPFRNRCFKASNFVCPEGLKIKNNRVKLSINGLLPIKCGKSVLVLEQYSIWTTR